MVQHRFVGLVFAAGMIALAGSCATDPGEPNASVGASASGVTTAGAVVIAESDTARARVTELRTRFQIAAGVARRFEVTADGHVRPVVDKRGVARSATVGLPKMTRDAVELADDTSRVAVRFALVGASESPATMTAGLVLYAKALGGSDVVHRAHAEGTEDYVIFEKRPSREEIAYDVDVSRVAGLRLVSNTLEFLDETGSPALRVAPPYVVDGKGARHDARLAVDGCAYDVNPAGPWGRAVTKPGAASCTVRVAWSGVAYPAMVDPAWTATGSMATARAYHTANLLASGLVLVAGGRMDGSSFLATAELFDPAASSGAGAFAATGSMGVPRGFGHTATVLASGKVLVAGGRMDGTTYIASAELYDPAAGTFGGVGTWMTSAREFHAASLLPSGKVLVTGGDNATNGDLRKADLFDPAANSGAGAFAATGSMGTARSQHTASVLGSGKVLVAGGFNISSAELFDPTANAGVGAFVATGSLATPRYGHTASVLATGKVLIAGAGASGEIFDPAANSGAGAFAATGSMAASRTWHVAGVLASGKVLVAGGSGSATLASAELFDPAANGGVGAFSPRNSMAMARQDHTGTVLASGKLVVVGGMGDGGGYLASAELFALVPSGGACLTPGECEEGVCEEGVCCAGACAGTCMTCTAGTGACATVTNADDPDTCTAASTCDAAGVCKLKNGQACPGGAGACVSGNCVDGYCCNVTCDSGCDRCDISGHAGTCTVAPSGNAGANPACAPPLACDGTSATCPTSCASDAACAPAYYCAPNGTCQPQKAQAAACSTTDCKVAGCRECASGACVDGVCCDKACNLPCEACAASLKQSGADGACGPTKDGIDPRNECASSGVVCGADGMCNGAGACRLFTPAGMACGPAEVCAAGLQTSATVCDGSGTCAAPPGIACGAYACGATACNTSCAKDQDCAPGNSCDTTSKCISGATCDGDHTARKVDGTTEDCAPYKCDSAGSCRSMCSSITDCVAPSVCDLSGKCVPPPTPDGASGGCSTVPGDSGSRNPVAPLALLGLAALFVRRRCR